MVEFKNRPLAALQFAAIVATESALRAVICAAVKLPLETPPTDLTRAPQPARFRLNALSCGAGCFRMSAMASGKLEPAVAAVPPRLAVVGSSGFTDAYAESVRRLAAADPRAVMAGGVFGEELAALYSNAAAFVLPSSLEGLPITTSTIADHIVQLLTNQPEAVLRELFRRGIEMSDLEVSGADLEDAFISLTTHKMDT